MSWLQELDFETADSIVRAWFEQETELADLGIEASVRSHPEWEAPSTLIDLRAPGYLGAIEFEYGLDRFKVVVHKSRRARLAAFAMFQTEPEPAFRFAVQLAVDLIAANRLAVLES